MKTSKKQPEILLINSPLADEQLFTTQEDYIPPLGLGYVSSSIQNGNIEIDFIDAAGADIPTSKLESIIYNKNPSIIGINIFTTNKGGSI